MPLIRIWIYMGRVGEEGALGGIQSGEEENLDPDPGTDYDRVKRSSRFR